MARIIRMGALRRNLRSVPHLATLTAVCYPLR
jgi:hypothetical protein